MDIQRINTYDDPRFSQTALYQHGCFLAGGKPYEVEIVSEWEAVIRGADPAAYREIAEEFRFYAPHITTFRDEAGNIAAEYPRARLLTLRLEQIQPSQFYVDETKIAAVGTFIHKPEDIVIQVLPHGDGYISLDGHTRLYYAVMKGWGQVRAAEESSADWAGAFLRKRRKEESIPPKT